MVLKKLEPEKPRRFHLPRHSLLSLSTLHSLLSLSLSTLYFQFTALRFPFSV